MDTFGQCRSPQELDCVIRAVGLMDFEAHYFAAIDIQRQVQINPLSGNAAGDEREIPTPQLPGRRSHMGARRSLALRCFGSASMPTLHLRSEYSAAAGFAGE